MAWKQCNNCLGFGEVVNGDGTKVTCSDCAGSGQVEDKGSGIMASDCKN